MYVCVYIFKKNSEECTSLVCVGLDSFNTFYSSDRRMVTFLCSWHNKKMLYIFSNWKCCRSCFPKVISKLYVLYSSYAAAYIEFKQLYLLNWTQTNYR